MPEKWSIKFIKSLVDSVYSMWSNTSKIYSLLEPQTVKTTDATVTTLALATLSDENTYHIRSIVMGVQSGGSNRASYEIAGTFYRSGGGATQQGSTTVIHSVESNAAWDCDYDTNGNDVRIRVTGAAVDILWQSTTAVYNMSN